jgi:CSLREA domain-containing protein
MKKKMIGIKILLSLLIIGLLMLATSPAMAAKIKVNSTDDIIANDGNCTLREAVIAANTDTASGSMTGECQAGNGADTIVLQDLVYFLSIAGAGEDAAATGDLDILDDLTIAGRQSNKTVINADKIDMVFHIIGNVKVNLKGVTIQNGLSDICGGIFNNGGTITITKSTISNNMASGDTAWGGGICNSALVTLTMTKSTISDNSASGVDNDGIGGGISNGGMLTVENQSKIFSNFASDYGGGLYNDGTYDISVNSKVIKNIPDDIDD